MSAWRRNARKYVRMLRRNAVSRRTRNGLLCALSTYFLGYMPERPLNAPTFIQVEVTSKCNLRCVMCKRASMFGSGRHLTLAEFKQIVDKVPTALQVHLQGYGEPLLNPDIIEMVRCCSEAGMWTSTSTNGLLLDEKGVSLLQAGIDEIGISVDGRKETYEKIRPGASFEKLEASVKNLLDARDRIRPSTEVWLLGVVMKENIAEMPQLVDLASDWGFDGVVIQHVTNSVEDIRENQERAISDHLTEIEQRYLEECVRRAKLNSLTHVIHSHEYDRKMRCFWPWSGLYVNADGNVSGCSVLYDPVVGNILKQDLSSIWQSREMINLRKKVKKGICQGCKFHYYNGEYII